MTDETRNDPPAENATPAQTFAGGTGPPPPRPRPRRPRRLHRLREREPVSYVSPLAAVRLFQHESSSSCSGRSCSTKTARLLLSWRHAGLSVLDSDEKASDLRRPRPRRPSPRARSRPRKAPGPLLRRLLGRRAREARRSPPGPASPAARLPRCRGVTRGVAFVTEPRVTRRILDLPGASTRRTTQGRAPPLATAPLPIPSDPQDGRGGCFHVRGRPEASSATARHRDTRIMFPGNRSETAPARRLTALETRSSCPSMTGRTCPPAPSPGRRTGSGRS
jgi:hypothetical protein